MRKAILAALLALITLTAGAQKKSQITEWDIYAGPMVGVNYSTLTSLKGNWQPGPVVGGFVEVYVTPQFSINVSASWSHVGTNHANASDSIIIKNYVPGSYSYQIDYINTVYMAKYHFNDTWAIEAGLNMGYEFTATRQRQGNSTKYNIEDHIHQGSFSIPVGVSYTINNKWQIDGTISCQVNKLATGNVGKRLLGNSRVMGAQVTVGYRFQCM